MKKTFLIIFTICIYLDVHAQKLELSVLANTNTSHFTGFLAANDSKLFESSSPNNTYPEMPYGKKYAWGYGSGIQAQFITRQSMIIGFAATYETLRSNVNITSFAPYDASKPGQFPSSYPADGVSHLSNQFINLSPGVGYRLIVKQLSIDILGGIDVGLKINSTVNSSLTANNKTYQINSTRSYPPHTDVRLRISTAINYGLFSLNGSYSSGMTAYKNNFAFFNSTAKAYNKIFRLGLGYRIK